MFTPLTNLITVPCHPSSSVILLVRKQTNYLIYQPKRSLLAEMSNFMKIFSLMSLSSPALLSLRWPIILVQSPWWPTTSLPPLTLLLTHLPLFFPTTKAYSLPPQKMMTFLLLLDLSNSLSNLLLRSIQTLHHRLLQLYYHLLRCHRFHPSCPLLQPRHPSFHQKHTHLNQPLRSVTPAAISPCQSSSTIMFAPTFSLINRLPWFQVRLKVHNIYWPIMFLITNISLHIDLLLINIVLS